MNSIRTHLRGWLIARGRQARQQVRRVSEQAADKARQAGRAVAARVLAVQRAAGLPDKLIRRSVQSVATRAPARPSDAAWRDGYLSLAAAGVELPGAARAEPHGQVTRYGNGATVEWEMPPPRPGRDAADREAGQ